MGMLTQKLHILADALTVYRFFISLAISYFHDIPILYTSIFVVTGWASDLFDGLLARKSGETYLGDLDVYVDIIFSFSILYYLCANEFLNPILTVLISLAFILAHILLRNDAPLMLWMALTYFSFIIYTYTHDKTSFIIVVIWVILTPLLTPMRSMIQIYHFFEEIKAMKHRY